MYNKFSAVIYNVIAQLKDYSLEGAVDYHYGHFPPSDMDYARLINPLRRAASAIARYDATLSGLHNKDLLLAPLRRQEAVITSRIEGTIATLDEILSFEADDADAELDPKKKLRHRQEAMEVYSYVRALNHAQQLLNEGLPICGRVIREAHGRMLFWGRGAEKHPGRCKTDQNYVIDQKNKTVLFIPISPEQLNDGIRNYEEFINSDDIDPLIQAALSHVEFEALHPFKDGNGRIGRMIITLMLWEKQLISGPYFFISGHFEDNRDEYIDRMRAVSSDNAWTDWCIFFLESVEAQANSNLEVARRIVTLYEEMKEQFRLLLASQWSINALDFIFGSPVFRNSVFTSTSGIPKQTAARFTKVLSGIGLLTTVVPAAGRRSAVYAFEPLLEIVRP